MVSRIAIDTQTMVVLGSKDFFKNVSKRRVIVPSEN